jgi:hypothetical protein
MKYQGQCSCGAVKFECDGEPLFTQYCHCNKCREVTSASQLASDKKGYAWTAAYLLKNFHLIGHARFEELIRNNAKLLRCTNCKALIYGISLDPKLQAGIGINANNFIFASDMPASFKPVRHIWYQDRIVDMHDDLPKFKDAPVEQGGSGEIWVIR